MEDILINIVGGLFYVSGLLIWPVCAFLWRKKRRTPASRWVFIAAVVCQLVLVGFFVFSRGLLEHQYYWLVLSLLANIGFTVLAIAAALYDYGSFRRPHDD